MSKDPRYNSMLRSTCVATGLTGGHATNALPQTAEVRINRCILPDAVPSEIRDGIIKALGDTAIEVSRAGQGNVVEPSPRKLEHGSGCLGMIADGAGACRPRRMRAPTGKR